MNAAWRAFLITLVIVFALTFAVQALFLHLPAVKVAGILVLEAVFFLLFSRPKPEVPAEPERA